MTDPVDGCDRPRQPAIFSMEYSLMEMWKAKGVTPTAVLGHSVGEYAASVTAGVMTLEDATKLIAARGRLIAEKCEAGVGSMVALFAPEKEVIAAIAALDKKEKAEIAVAGVNGPKLTVVSGRSAVVEKVVTAVGAGNRALNVSHAFHSPMMNPMLKDFKKLVSAAKLSKPEGVKFISTVTGKDILRCCALVCIFYYVLFICISSLVSPGAPSVSLAGGRRTCKR